MNKLNNEQLSQINGGTLTGAFLQYISKLATTIFDIGRALGSSVRRIQSDNICPL